MSWNHRGDGSWRSATIKRREDGRWVDVRDDRGGSGDFGWRDPPERSSTIYSSSYSSLQDALDALSADERLIVDDGPHEGPVTYDQDHSTISGGEDGATITLPSSESWPIVDMPRESYTSVSADPIERGDRVIGVDDASQFAAGDDVRIFDENQSYRGLSDLGTGADIPTGEYQTVESVDASADAVTIVGSADRDYPDENGTLECQPVDWGMEDVHLDNLTLRGFDTNSSTSGESLRAFRTSGTKDGWYTDLHGETWGRSFVTVTYSYNVYLDSCTADDLGRNGITASSGAKNVIGRTLSVTNGDHYGVNSGWSRHYNPGRNHYWVDCEVANATDAGYDQHHGSEHVVFENCDVAGSAVGNKLRALETTVRGGTYDDIDGHAFQMTQKPEHVRVEGVVVDGVDRICKFWPKEGYAVEQFALEDCQFRNVRDELCWFRDDGNGCPVEGLEFVNCSYNGEWVDDGLVEASSGFDASQHQYATEYPSDRTPDEYFG